GTFVTSAADGSTALSYLLHDWNSPTCSSSPAPDSTKTFDVVAVGPATQFAITGSMVQTAGTVNNLTITARDAAGNTATSYSGTKFLRFSGASPSVSPVVYPSVVGSNLSEVSFGNATSISFVAGVATVSSGRNGVMKLYKAEIAAIAVTDGT